MENKRVLECSSRGDKRFSAFYARLSFYGKVDSIENIYQSVKRDSNNKVPGKGKKVDHIEINGHELDVKYLTPLYKMLWTKYLDTNPELVEYASQYDDFSDIFKGKYTVNCQADVIRQYIKEGRKSIMSEPLVRELNSIMKSWKKNKNNTIENKVTGKIYLSSYYTRDYNVPEGATFINVARKDMIGIDYKIIDLAPSKELFSWYWAHKEEYNWFDHYKEEYERQIINNEYAQKTLLKLRDRVLAGENICLLCFCRKSNKCHRSLLGEMFKKYGIEIIDTDN